MGTSEGEARTALMTGASSGIGEASAHGLAASHHGLMRVARRKDKLAALAKVLNAADGARVTLLPADLALADAARAATAALQRKQMADDVRDDNTGVRQRAVFVAMPAQRQPQLTDPSVSGLTAMRASASQRPGWGGASAGC